MPKGELEQQPDTLRLSRRQLLRSAALGGPGLMGAYLLACKVSNSTPKPTAGTSPTLPRIVTLSSEPMTWSQLSVAGAKPPARHDHSLVTDGRHLYLFGGRDASSSLADFWSYDIAANAWTAVAAFGPQARFGHNAIWDSGRSLVLLFGGQDGANFYNDVWEFDPLQALWTQVSFSGPVPAPRYGAAAAYDGAGHLFMSHGFTTQGRFDDIWQYDLAAHTWADISPAVKRPLKRCLLRGVWDSLKTRFIIFAGQTDGTPFLEDLWAWSTVTEWQELARDPHPDARNLYSMVFHDPGAQIILFGGNTAQGPVNDLWSFHSSGENWTRFPTEGATPPPRYGQDMALVTQAPSIFVFGGTDGSQGFDDLWHVAPAASPATP